MANPMQEKLHGHAERMASLTRRERLRYVYNWVKMKANRVYLRTGFRVAGLAGVSLPYTFVEDYLQEANLKAVFNYVPQQYPGRILLFRASESLPRNPLDDPMGWGPLAAEGVEQYVVHGTHRIVDEPYVIEVAARLQQALDKVQVILSP
jgi:thioesterase domain-containing protein